MKSNWHVSQERFKSLQVQARAGRTEKDVLAKELAELKEKMEAATSTTAGAVLSAVRGFSICQSSSRLLSRAVAID